MPIIEFGEWMPDLPAISNPGATTATNVLPAGTTYKPFKDCAAISTDALTADCAGAFSTRDFSGNAVTFAGDATKLYRYASNTHSDVSSATYNLATDEQWEFIQAGEIVVASNFGDPMQVWTLGSATAFSNLGGAPPKAKHVAAVRNFLVAGNTNDATDGDVHQRVRWSALDNYASWTVAASTQADYQDLEGDGGAVQRVIGGEYGVVFTEREIYRMTYVGSPVIFQFDSVESKRGTPAPGSCIKVGNWVFYLSDDGFYLFDGQESVPIGANRIDRFFWEDVDSSFLWKISTALDPTDKIIYLAYPSNDATDGTPDRILCYNYDANATKRWTLVEKENNYIFVQQSEGYTLDGLDSVSTNLDSLQFSLDSRAWTSNGVQLAGYTSTNYLANFSGDPLTATLETSERQFIQGRRSRLFRARPILEGSTATITMQVGERNKINEDVTWQGARTQLTSGDIPLRSNAFYHRFRATITGDFDHAVGFEIEDPRDGGKR